MVDFVNLFAPAHLENKMNELGDKGNIRDEVVEIVCRTYSFWNHG